MIRIEERRPMAEGISEAPFVKIPNSGHLENLENPKPSTRHSSTSRQTKLGRSPFTYLFVAKPFARCKRFAAKK